MGGGGWAHGEAYRMNNQEGETMTIDYIRELEGMHAEAALEAPAKLEELALARARVEQIKFEHGLILGRKATLAGVVGDLRQQNRARVEAEDAQDAQWTRLAHALGRAIGDETTIADAREYVLKHLPGILPQSEPEYDISGPDTARRAPRTFELAEEDQG